MALAFVSASGGGSGSSGLTQLFTSTLGGSAASIDIPSISASYSALRLQLVGRSDAATTVVSVNIIFNADTAANYAQNYLQANAGVATGHADNAQPNINAAGISAASATAGLPGILVMDVPFYAATTFNKIVHISSTWNTTATANTLRETGAIWRSTAAITEITLTPSSGNFIAGTAVTLWGLT